MEHRYRALGGTDAYVIGVERRLNLNDLIADRYGANYIKNPKMLSLMALNGGRHREFLQGQEEVNAFENKEFLRMHNSTLSKIGFFSSIMRKLVKGKLKTTAKTIGFIGTLGTITGLVITLWNIF